MPMGWSWSSSTTQPEGKPSDSHSFGDQCFEKYKQSDASESALTSERTEESSSDDELKKREALAACTVEHGEP
jgi:hypothetical protein